MRILIEVVLFDFAVLVLYYGSLVSGVYRRIAFGRRVQADLRSSSCLWSNWAISRPARSSRDLLGGGVLRPWSDVFCGAIGED